MPPKRKSNIEHYNNGITHVNAGKCTKKKGTGRGWRKKVEEMIQEFSAAGEDIMEADSSIDKENIQISTCFYRFSISLLLDMMHTASIGPYHVVHLPAIPSNRSDDNNEISNDLLCSQHSVLQDIDTNTDAQLDHSLPRPLSPAHPELYDYSLYAKAHETYTQAREDSTQSGAAFLPSNLFPTLCSSNQSLSMTPLHVPASISIPEPEKHLDDPKLWTQLISSSLQALDKRKYHGCEFQEWADKYCCGKFPIPRDRLAIALSEDSDPAFIPTESDKSFETTSGEPPSEPRHSHASSESSRSSYWSELSDDSLSGNISNVNEEELDDLLLDLIENNPLECLVEELGGTHDLLPHSQ